MSGAWESPPLGTTGTLVVQLTPETMPIFAAVTGGRVSDDGQAIVVSPTMVPGRVDLVLRGVRASNVVTHSDDNASTFEFDLSTARGPEVLDKEETNIEKES